MHQFYVVHEGTNNQHNDPIIQDKDTNHWLMRMTQIHTTHTTDMHTHSRYSRDSKSDTTQKP